MITKLEQKAVDPYARRVMEEEEFMAMNIDFWKQTIVNKDSIIAYKDSIIAAVSAELVQSDKEKDIARNTIVQKDKELAQRDKELAQRDKELEEYRCRYGKINDAIN